MVVGQVFNCFWVFNCYYIYILNLCFEGCSIEHYWLAVVPPVPHLSSHAYLLENTCLECIYLLSYVSERIICEMFSIQICHSATFTQANEYEF